MRSPSARDLIPRHEVRQAFPYSGEAIPEQTLAVQLTAALEQVEASAEDAELGRVLRRLQAATGRLADMLWAWDRQVATRDPGRTPT